MVQFSEEERKALSAIINHHIFRKAVTTALAEASYRESGGETLEQCALAYKSDEGAKKVIDILYGLAELKEPPKALPRRLIHKLT